METQDTSMICGFPTNTEMLNDHCLNVQSRRPIMVQKQIQTESCAYIWDVAQPSAPTPKSKDIMRNDIFKMKPMSFC